MHIMYSTLRPLDHNIVPAVSLNVIQRALFPAQAVLVWHFPDHETNFARGILVTSTNPHTLCGRRLVIRAHHSLFTNFLF